MRRIRPLLVLAALTAANGVAYADEPVASEQRPPPGATAATDNVHLRGGGIQRGRVTELVPGDHVTVVAEGGEAKRIPWSEVEELVMPASPPRSEGAAAPPLAPTPAGPVVRVHITTPKSVMLQRRAAGSIDWGPVCMSPCDMDVPAGTYRITGKDVGTKELVLEAGSKTAANIEVHPRSVPGMVMGITLTSVGAVTASFSLGAWLLDSVMGSMGHGSGRDSRSNAPLGIAALGAATALVGVFVLVRSAKTDVVQSHHGKAGSRPPHYAREPMFAGATTAPAPATPAVTWPLVFTHAF
jgi:hypothetical protein